MEGKDLLCSLSLSLLQFYMPPTYLSFLGLIFNALFYSVLAWYLDAVFPGNHGIPRKWYVMVTFNIFTLTILCPPS